MLTKYGSIVTIEEAGRYRKQGARFPSFMQNNDSVMDRLASVEPVALEPDKFLYMRVRIVSAVERHGPNANGDAFEHQELIARHPTLIRSAVNIDHQNDDLRKAVGFILDARYLPKSFYVEGVHAIDRVLADSRRPNLCHDIEAGIITDTSMGCFVEQSVCSACLREAGWDGNWDVDNPDRVNKYVAMLKAGRGIARVPEEYCRHIGRFGEKKGGLGGPFEINRDVTFFEDSIITTAGADKDAKYLEKIASAQSPNWTKYLIHRTLVNGAVVEASKNLKGAEEMANKKEAGESELNEGKKVSREDKGDTNSGHAKYDEQFKESKGKSDKKDDDTKGSNLASAEGRGDYALAAKKDLEAIARVKALAKDNKKEIIALISEAGEGTDGFDVEEKKEEKEEEPKEENKKEGAVKEGKSLMEKAADLLRATAALLGNQLDTMEEKGEYGDGHKKYVEQASEAKGKSDSKDDDKRGSQNMTMEGKKDYPLKKGAAVEKEDEPLEVEGEDVKGKTQEEDGRVKERMARRRKLAEDLNHGSMGADGKPEEDGPKLSGHEKDPVEKLKEFHDKVEEPAGDALETAEEKAVAASKKEMKVEAGGPGSGPQKGDMVHPHKDGYNQGTQGKVTKRDGDLYTVKWNSGMEGTYDNSTTPFPKIKKSAEAADGHDSKAEAEVAKGNEDTKDSKEMRKDAAEHDSDHKIEEEDKEEEPTSSFDPSSKTSMASLVDSLDEKEAGLRQLIEAKQERVEVLAAAGYDNTADYHSEGIAYLEKKAEVIVGIADKIAALIENSEKLDNAKLAAITTSLSNLVKEAEKHVASLDATLEKMKVADIAKEESYTAAQKVVEAQERVIVAEKKAEKYKGSLTAVIKGKVIADTIKIGQKKGVVTASNRNEMIEKLSGMDEVQFEATRTAWVDLPDQVRQASVKDEDGYVDSLTREASVEKSEGMGELIKKEAADKSGDDSLDDPEFFA